MNQIQASKVEVGQTIGHAMIATFVPYGTVEKIIPDGDVVLFQIGEGKYRRYRMSDMVTIP